MDASISGGSKEGGSNKQADAILKKHMFLVTGKEFLKKSNPNAFLLPRHSRCEAFSTFSAAGLLVSEHYLSALHSVLIFVLQEISPIIIPNKYFNPISHSLLSLDGTSHPLSLLGLTIWIATLLTPILVIIFP